MKKVCFIFCATWLVLVGCSSTKDTTDGGTTTDGGGGGADGSGSGTVCASTCTKVCPSLPKSQCDLACSMIPANCKTQMDALATCVDKAPDAKCDNGQPTAASCKTQQDALTTCLQPTCKSICAKHCASKQAMCETGCGMLDGKCNQQRDELLSCLDGASGVTCSMDGEPSAASCAQQKQAANDCLSPPMDGGSD